MKYDQIQRIVAEVISRLAQRLDADGRRGCLIVVFSAATAGFSEAVQQVCFLILEGYRLQLAFSESAERMFGQTVRDQLAGFPHFSLVDPTGWFSALKEARALVCPLMSVNTLSKLSLLIADNLVTNLILHGLFMGKPVIVARNGVDTADPGRKALSFDKGTPALKQALVNRLLTVADYGCRVGDVRHLKKIVNSVLAGEKDSSAKRQGPNTYSGPATFPYSGQLVTAVDIRRAHSLDARLAISAASLITPLARDLAVQLGVSFVESDDVSSQ
jgi:hypothetical protein